MTTPSQRKVLEQLAREHNGCTLQERGDDGTLTIKLGTGERILVGVRGGIRDAPQTPQEAAEAPQNLPPEETSDEPAGSPENGAEDAASPVEEEIPAGDSEVVLEGDEPPAGVTPAPTPDPAEADAFKPQTADLVVREPDDVFRVMDRNDELMILDALLDRATEEWVYSFSQGGGLVTDLSVVGVNECVREMNERGGTKIGIAPDPPIVSEVEEEGESWYRVMVRSVEGRSGVSRWGTAVEPKHMTLRNGNKVWDKFALTKALNKAQRNALRMMVSEEMRFKIIAVALGQGKVKMLDQSAETLTELPPPLTDDKAETLKAEIRAEYEKLKELNRLAMPPGRFNAYLTRTEHSHERLEEFLAHVRELRAKEEKA